MSIWYPAENIGVFDCGGRSYHPDEVDLPSGDFREWHRPARPTPKTQVSHSR